MSRNVRKVIAIFFQNKTGAPKNIFIIIKRKIFPSSTHASLLLRRCRFFGSEEKYDKA